MTCDQIRNRLDDYVDGALGDSDRREVERHLTGCAGCRAEERSLRGLLDAAAGLPRSITPGRDLWPAIAAAVEQEGGEAKGARRPPVPAWLTLPRLAAAAVVLVALTAAITLLFVAPGGDETPVAAYPEPAAGTAPVALAADFRAVEGEFQKANRLLAAVLEQRRAELSPETVALVEKNLAIINRAIIAVRAAIESDPGNRELGMLLTAMYRSKVDLLQRAARLPAAI